jgi:aminopeptidase N
MWFGNLVTNKWWTDLWLNESFAEFISHFCLSHLKLTREINDIWVNFNNRKNWGYNADQLSTTHPIAGEIHNTEEAENIFDGITYAKGAAVLSQLVALIGEKRFSTGLKRYFEKYQWSNATLDEFFGSFDNLSDVVGFDISTWKQQWICTAGLNELVAKVIA